MKRFDTRMKFLRLFLAGISMTLGLVRQAHSEPALNGRPVRTLHDIARFLFLAHPGDLVTLTIYRDGRTIPLRITLPPMQMNDPGP